MGSNSNLEVDHLDALLVRLAVDKSSREEAAAKDDTVTHRRHAVVLGHRLVAGHVKVVAHEVAALAPKPSKRGITKEDIVEITVREHRRCQLTAVDLAVGRSEERRVGKEG